MTISSTDRTATYNGSATSGGASVNVTYPSSGASVKHGTTDGTYDLDSIPTFTDAGEYTVYYKATEAGDYVVYYKVIGDFNHEDVAEASVNVTIPSGTSTVAQYDVYVVQKGDNFWKIGKKLGIDVKTLIAMNEVIAKQKYLYIGQKLNILGK